MNAAKILLFADGSRTLGSGHVVRTLVLARELMELGNSVLVAGTNVTQLGKSMTSFAGVPTKECKSPAELAERKELAEEFGPTLVVVDGYEFDEEFFIWLSGCTFPHGVIDDFGQTRAWGPLFILDTNPGSDQVDYDERFPEASLLLGKCFSLIRREFLDAASHQNSTGANSYVMVSLGGTDILDLGLEVSFALAKAGLCVKVSTGHQSLSRQQSKKMFDSHPNVSVVSQSDYEITLADASCAVLGAGTSLWESLMLGIPTFGIIVADNQVRGARIEEERNPLLTVLDVRDSQRVIDKLPELVRDVLEARKNAGLVFSQPRITHSARRAAERIGHLIKS